MWLVGAPDRSPQNVPQGYVDYVKVKPPEQQRSGRSSLTLSLCPRKPVPRWEVPSCCAGAGTSQPGAGLASAPETEDLELRSPCKHTLVSVTNWCPKPTFCSHPYQLPTWKPVLLCLVKPPQFVSLCKGCMNSLLNFSLTWTKIFFKNTTIL